MSSSVDTSEILKLILWSFSTYLASVSSKVIDDSVSILSFLNFSFFYSLISIVFGLTNCFSRFFIVFSFAMLSLRKSPNVFLIFELVFFRLLIYSVSAVFRFFIRPSSSSTFLYYRLIYSISYLNLSTKLDFIIKLSLRVRCFWFVSLKFFSICS